MPAPQLVLETTAYTIDQLVGSETPQLALAGRSNVGKSSLVNALAGRRKLARVSATPGKTRSVNYYRVDPYGFCLVDLPGYGYARASRGEREKWAKLLERYLSGCRALRGLVLLIDSRLPPQALDLNLLEYAQSIGLPVIPVLTKADKCRQRETGARVNEWTELAGRRPVITSSAARRGMRELWKALFAQAGVDLPADAVPDAASAAAPDIASAAAPDAAPAAAPGDAPDTVPDGGSAPASAAADGDRS